jgi:hypothetical protein
MNLNRSMGQIMAYTGGTAAAQECIAQLTELKALVDIYSRKWLATRQDFVDITAEDLVSYQQRSNGACEGHLLIISTSLDMDAATRLLPSALPSFAAYFGDRAPYHKPDLIFINLATQQILCIGLGRKNYFFGFAIGADEVKISDGNIRDAIRPWSNPNSIDPTLFFLREFIKYDYANIVLNLVEALYEFGICARNWDHLPLVPDQIEEIIDQGPDVEGMYDIDDQMMSLEEARSVIAEFEETDDWGKENLSTLQEFFPDLTWGDLNTQDY